MKSNSLLSILLFASLNTLNSQVQIIDARDRALNAIINGSDKAMNHKGIDQANKFWGIYLSAKDLYESCDALRKGECIPDFTTDPEAMVPTSCPDSTGCVACYTQAYRNFQSVRKRLSKLKCLGNSTKSFVNNSIAFGDQVSSIHAIQGLAWQKEKKGIKESYEKFKAGYDAKYKELMEKLMDSMNDIDICESKNGQADWFKRFGFMYFEFMSEKYKRSE
jgi:hypothetical protein